MDCPRQQCQAIWAFERVSYELRICAVSDEYQNDSRSTNKTSIHDQPPVSRTYQVARFGRIAEALGSRILGLLGQLHD